jgi:uncharacterized protein
MSHPITRHIIPGLPAAESERLLDVLAAHPAVESVWLYGSRAMGRHRPGSDVDLSIGGDQLRHHDLLQLMESIDDLLLPWKVDLSLVDNLNEDVREHVSRVGMVVLERSGAQNR